MLSDNRDDPNAMLAGSREGAELGDMNERDRGMPREATRPKGWLAERLDRLGWSLHGFSEMIDEHYKQAMRWNSGVYEPPAPVMRWLEAAERFFAENPPPRRADYANVVHDPAPEPPSAFVKRIIDAMKPGETATTDEIRVRIGARRKAVEQRLAAASVSGRLGPLRRVGDAVYRAIGDEVPPGGSLTFDPVAEPAATAFVGQVLEVLRPGEEVDLAEVSARTGFRTGVIERRLAKAAEAGRLGEIELVGEGRIRRLTEGGEAEEAAPVQSPVPPPSLAPAAARPTRKAKYVPVTQAEMHDLIKAIGWSTYDVARALEWPGKDDREVRRWFSSQDRYPTPPKVAEWLRETARIKREAEKAIPAGTPPAAAAAMISAALIGQLSVAASVREAALEDRRRERLGRHEAGEALTDGPVSPQPAPTETVVVPPQASAPKAPPPEDAPILAPDGGEVSEEAAEILLALGDEWMPWTDLRVPMSYLDRLRRRGLIERGSRPSMTAPDGYEPLFRLSQIGRQIKAAILGRGRGEQSILERRKSDIERRKAEAALRASAEDAAAARHPSKIPGVSYNTYRTALYAILQWIGMGEMPDDVEAKADAEEALRATRERGMSTRGWVTAAKAWLEREGYEVDEGEDDPASEPAEVEAPEPEPEPEPDYSGPSVRRGGVIDLTKGEG
jgi:hypothetical protein